MAFKGRIFRSLTISLGASLAFAILPAMTASATDPVATITSISANVTTTTYGSTVTYTMFVNPVSGTGPVTGDVELTGHSDALGLDTNSNFKYFCYVALVNNEASCTSMAALPSAPGGFDSIYADYLGDANNAQSVGSTALIVFPAQTSLTASIVPGESLPGAGVTYSAAVSNTSGPDGTYAPYGQVAFSIGTTPLCTLTLIEGTPVPSASTGSCSASNAPLGVDTVTAEFAGNTYYAPSTAQGVVNVTTGASAPPPPPPPSTPPPTTPNAPTPAPPVTTSAPHGYWLVGSDGGIFSFGSAQFHGSTGDLVLQRQVVGITPTSDDGGYWLDASDGGIFAFGDAGFYGSIPGLGIRPAGSGLSDSLNAPIVGMVPSSDGQGYFMVGSDGGVFAFGDATYAGSCPAIGGCTGAAVAVIPDAAGNGYWLVTKQGYVYTFGDAPTLGSAGPQEGAVPVTSAVRTPDGVGYWILFANGVVDAFGDAANYGSPIGPGDTGPLNPATAIFATGAGNGYWVAAADGAVYAFADAPNDGSMAGQHLNAPIIAATGW
jgi:hypothetical protein